MMKEIQDLSTFLEEQYRKLSWLKKVYYFFLRRTRDFHAARQKFECFFIRGKKGYSYLDTWSFDAYLCKVIPGGIQTLIDNLHGAPVDLMDEGDNDPLSKWRETLEKIRDGFLAGQKIIDMDFWVIGDDAETNMKMENRLRAEFEEGMDLFKKYFFHLWD